MTHKMSASPVSPSTFDRQLPRQLFMTGPRSERELKAPNGDPLSPAEIDDPGHDEKDIEKLEKFVATEDVPGEAVGEAGTETIRVAHDPVKPSAQLVEKHRVTHYPYERWCRECIEGKALGEYHSSKDRTRYSDHWDRLFLYHGRERAGGQV